MRQVRSSNPSKGGSVAGLAKNSFVFSLSYSIIHVMSVGKYERTQEIKQKISKSARANPTRYWAGKSRSEETKRKISESLKGNPSPMKGKKHSLETRKKISAIQKNRKLTEEHKRKIGLGGKGLKRSEETKGRIRAATTGEKNYAWKGDGVSYRTLHAWVARHLGQPSECDNCDRQSIAYHWSNISGQYKRELTDWVRLCQSCHFLIDGVGRKEYKKVAKLVGTEQNI